MKLLILSALALLIHPSANANIINPREYNLFLLGRVVGATEVVCREKVNVNKRNFYADSREIFNDTREILPEEIVKQAWQDLRRNCKKIVGVDIGEL